MRHLAIVAQKLLMWRLESLSRSTRLVHEICVTLPMQTKGAFVVVL